MNPQIALALIAKFTDLPAEDAERIAKELSTAVQPATYKDAERLIEKLVSNAKSKRRTPLA